MTKSQVKKLRIGDAVYWNDPDDGACSRWVRIKDISVKGDCVTIQELDGDIIEGPFKEFEPPQKLKLRLILDVEYTPLGTAESTLKHLLKEMVQHSADRGLLTGEEPAEVERWAMVVDKIS